MISEFYFIYWDQRPVITEVARQPMRINRFEGQIDKKVVGLVEQQCPDRSICFHTHVLPALSRHAYSIVLWALVSSLK
jgi:hypothetical protein